MEDDNKLVKLEDLDKIRAPINTLWNDEELISDLKQKIEALKNIKFLPSGVIDLAVSDVINAVGWDSYDSYKNKIDSILSGVNYPYCSKIKNRETGKHDFWIVRTFIDMNNSYEFSDITYSKKDVLTSKEFNDSLNKYLKTNFKNEIHSWFYLVDGEEGHVLNIPQSHNMKHLIMFQFKKKLNDVIIGQNRPKQSQ